MQRLRQARGWSQEEPAARARVHRNHIGPIKRAERKVSVDIMERIADALKTELADMLRTEPSAGDGFSRASTARQDEER